MTQIVESGFGKFALRLFGKEVVVAEKLEDLAEVAEVLGEGRAINQDVIEKYRDAFAKQGL